MFARLDCTGDHPPSVVTEGTDKPVALEPGVEGSNHFCSTIQSLDFRISRGIDRNLRVHARLAIIRGPRECSLRAQIARICRNLSGRDFARSADHRFRFAPASSPSIRSLTPNKTTLNRDHEREASISDADARKPFSSASSMDAFAEQDGASIIRRGRAFAVAPSFDLHRVYPPTATGDARTARSKAQLRM
jgi:hypothetical protein